MFVVDQFLISNIHFIVVDILQIGGKCLFDLCGKGKSVAFLSVDPSTGVRSGTTSGAVASSSLGELGPLALLVVSHVVDLAFVIKMAVHGSGCELLKLLCGGVLDDGGGASSTDTAEALAGSSDVVIVHDNGWAAHLGCLGEVIDCVEYIDWICFGWVQLNEK